MRTRREWKVYLYCLSRDSRKRQEAAARVRKIVEVNRISYSEFRLLKMENERDPYLHCRNIQEQRMIPNFDKRIQDDRYLLSSGKEESKNNRRYRQERARILEREFIRQLEEMQKSVAG